MDLVAPERRDRNDIGILSLALRTASDSDGRAATSELTSDFVTRRVCKSPRQFNYRTEADAIVRRWLALGVLRA